MKHANLNELVSPWLIDLPQGALLSALVTNCIGFVGLLLVYIFLRRLLLPFIQKVLTKVSPTRIGYLAPQLSILSTRLAILLCCVVLLALDERLFILGNVSFRVLDILAHILLIVMSGFVFSGFINLTHAIYNQLRFAKDVPIQGIVQVFKLITFIICAILIISLLLDKSPTYILSGFGAIAAVTLLVFKDTILGLVASIQIAANRLVKIGDWIEVKTFGADGEVIDLGLNTVRVRNWDNTITTIPTYILISDSFKNWRAMQESPGRRIKRAILVDMHSIKSIDNSELARLKASFPELDNYQVKQNSTNLGVFRYYAQHYLQRHQQINQECTCMVRALAPAQYGIPIEFYCFSKDKKWIAYEHLQADIVEHMLALMGEFSLKPYQRVSGQIQDQTIN